MTIEFAYKIFLTSLIPIGLYIFFRLVSNLIDIYKEISLIQEKNGGVYVFDVSKTEGENENLFEKLLSKFIRFARKHHIF